MTRSSNSQRAKRINAAFALLREYGSPSKAAKVLIDRYSVSRRQAYRYVQEAERIGKQIPIPEEKSTFTVKLSLKLVRLVREYANTTGQSISEVVTRALEAFIGKGHGRG